VVSLKKKGELVKKSRRDEGGKSGQTRKNSTIERNPRKDGEVWKEEMRIALNIRIGD